MLTLASPVSAEFVIRRSRFLVHAGPVRDQAATLDFFRSVKDAAASHNCWAWKLDHTYRFNDDGEPSGTAGKPILAAIEAKSLCRVMVVVTRYFGGVKLGVGGLVRAYSGSAAKCLDQGCTIEQHPTTRCQVECGFEHIGQVHPVVESCGAVKEGEEFTSKGVRIALTVRLDRIRQLEMLLRDATRGSARLVRS